MKVFCKYCIQNTFSKYFLIHALRNYVYAIEFVHLDLNGLTWKGNQAYVILQPRCFQFPMQLLPFFVFVFAAQCTLVQSAVGLLRPHVVRPSVRLSVGPSVTLLDCDHIGWKSWTISLRSLQPQGDPLTPRGTWENFVESRGGVGKSGMLENKSGNISETRKDKQKVTMDDV